MQWQLIDVLENRSNVEQLQNASNLEILVVYVGTFMFNLD